MPPRFSDFNQYCTKYPEIYLNKIYLLIKYIKSVLWIVAKRLSYIQDARCLKVNYKKMEAKILALRYTKPREYNVFELCGKDKREFTECLFARGSQYLFYVN